MPKRVGLPKSGIDMTTIEGLADMKYECPNLRVQTVAVDTGVPVGFWRSVGASHNAFYVESFIDDRPGRDERPLRRHGQAHPLPPHQQPQAHPGKEGVSSETKK